MIRVYRLDAASDRRRVGIFVWCVGPAAGPHTPKIDPGQRHGPARVLEGLVPEPREPGRAAGDEPSGEGRDAHPGGEVGRDDVLARPGQPRAHARRAENPSSERRPRRQVPTSIFAPTRRSCFGPHSRPDGGLDSYEIYDIRIGAQHHSMRCRAVSVEFFIEGPAIRSPKRRNTRS